MSSSTYALSGMTLAEFGQLCEWVKTRKSFGKFKVVSLHPVIKMEDMLIYQLRIRMSDKSTFTLQTGDTVVQDYRVKPSFLSYVQDRLLSLDIQPRPMPIHRHTAGLHRFLALFEESV